MGPILSALFVGASFISSLSANRSQQKMEGANIELQLEQSRLQASEAALDRTKSYRQNTAQALALSGMGFGSTTALAAAYGEGFSNYMQDIKALDRRAEFAGAQATSEKAASKAKGRANMMGSAESAYSLASKLGLFT